MKRSMLKGLVSIGAAFSVFQLGGCDAVRYVAGLNPCLTILACDPAVYEFSRSGLDGTNFDANIDPFCSLPPFCSAEDDPIFGGIFGGP
jgi:hypothetical protein